MFEMKWFLFCTNNRGDRQRFPIGLQQPRPQLNSTKEGEIESSPVASGPSRGEGGGGGAPGSGHCLVLGRELVACTTRPAGPSARAAFHKRAAAEAVSRSLPSSRMHLPFTVASPTA